MRQDYVYTVKNINLCLIINEKGKAYCNKLPKEGTDQASAPMHELLLLIQRDCLIIEDSSDIDKLDAVIDKTYIDQFKSVNTGVAKETLFKAIMEGYIGFRVVLSDQQPQDSERESCRLQKLLKEEKI